MTDTIMPFTSTAPENLKKSVIDQVARRIVFTLLKQIQMGQITLVEDGRRYTFGTLQGRMAMKADIHIHHPNTYTRTVFVGSIGTAEAFMAGLWSTDDLTTLIRIVILNQQVFKDLDSSWMRLAEPLNKIYHWARRNTPSGSRENIVAHYDLGNDFYRLFLDETMTYSAGIYERPDSTLHEASIAKYDRICTKLHLSAEDHVLEIGSGWGGFALHAARHYGCRVTTTTISDQQHALARQRTEDAGLGDRITLLKKDYRYLGGKFDKLVSIEMVEAVGHHYLGTFFRKCSDLLRDDGTMLLQSIIIKDQEYDQHCRSVDFIKRYIFPGSCIPSIAAISQIVKSHTDMNLCHMEDITPHYVRTLADWRQRFLNNIASVRKMGFSDAFIRMWEYYLSYCEAGFAERYIGNVQILMAKPLFRYYPVFLHFFKR